MFCLLIGALHINLYQINDEHQGQGLSTQLLRQTIAQVEATAGAPVRVITGVADMTNLAAINSGAISPCEHSMRALNYETSTVWDLAAGVWRLEARPK